MSRTRIGAEHRDALARWYNDSRFRYPGDAEEQRWAGLYSDINLLLVIGEQTAKKLQEAIERLEWMGDDERIPVDTYPLTKLLDVLRGES